ncbi:MAG: glycoside hydrolase family 3 N-terminal domain-containing protein [Alphaproteobacteria bacterium]|nr:glycoside hydrolase family 3 N-terminal domain-containing protein [Alphaproteobacteria bacterium]
MKPILSAILSIQGTELSDAEKRLFSQYNPYGINLFGRNIKSKTQLKTLIKQIKETVEREDIIIAIDQEGGRVRRLIEPEFRAYVPQHILGIEDENYSKLHAHLISSDLKELGINMNYAPVLDLSYPETTLAIKSRCLSDNEKTVAKLGKIMVEEYLSCGICPCLKHIPGHGKAVTDPHLGLPIVSASHKELEKDFFPFKEMNTAPSAMTAHLIIEAFDNKHPITQSKKAIDELIRGEIGFKGLLISDAIDMHALKGTISEKYQQSIHAGCDVVCYALGKETALQEICENALYLNDSALERAKRISQITNKEMDFSKVDSYAKAYQKISLNTEIYHDNYDATEILNLLNKN